MSAMSLFRRIENKHDAYSSEDCMKLCESLRKLAMRIINFKTKKSKLLTKEQQESYENAKICYSFEERFEKSNRKIKNIAKLEIIVIIQGEYRGHAHSISNLKYSVPKRLPVIYKK